MTRQSSSRTSTRHALENNHPAYSSYMKHLRRRGLSPRTIDGYADCLGVFALWSSSENPTRMTPSILESFQTYLANEYEYRGKTISRGRQGVYVAVLRGFYRYLHRERMILSNTAKGLRYPKTPKRIARDILTADELRRLLAVRCSLRDRLAVRIMALSGLRATEVANLNIEHVNLPERELTIRVGKGRRDRLVFIDPATRRLMARRFLQGQPSAPVFADDNGQRLNKDHLRRIVRQVAKSAGIDRTIGCHSLRRTFCTLMLKSGMNLKALAELTGHRRLKTTATYAAADIDTLATVYRQCHPMAARG